MPPLLMTKDLQWENLCDHEGEPYGKRADFLQYQLFHYYEPNRFDTYDVYKNGKYYETFADSLAFQCWLIEVQNAQRVQPHP